MAAKLRWLSPAVWTGGALPAAFLAVGFTRGTLGANPVEAVLHRLGLLAVVALVACLSCTPAMLAFKWTWPARVRRALGDLAFGYASAHLLLYLLADRGGSLELLLEDVVKRPFITVGLLAWAVMLPLFVTSSAAMVRALGFTKWKRLHRLAYAAGALGVLHFAWGQKKSITEPLVWGAVLGLGFLLRAQDGWRRKARDARRAGAV